MKRVRQNKVAILLFTMPALTIYTLVVFYPILQTAIQSFYKWDGINPGEFIGLQNYVKLFTRDRAFRTAILNGLLFPTVTVLYQIDFGSVLAFVLSSKRIRGSRFFRSAYFIPSTLSTVIVCKLWLAVLASDPSSLGLLNRLFVLFGLSYRQNWLSSGLSGILIMGLVAAWQGIGNTVLILYTAVKSIPEQYYEAALTDGATSFQAHTKITIPLLSETYKMLLILILSGGLRAFEHMYIMTGGGPGNQTTTLTNLMYKSTYLSNNFGYACAVAMTLVLECLLFTLLINRFVARERITY